MLTKNYQRLYAFVARTFLFGLLFVCNVAIAQTASDISNTDSAVIHLADPTIFHYKKIYYLYGTVEGAADNGFLVYTSADLKSWKISAVNNGFALKIGDAYGSKGFWAPQVFAYNKKFYMAYVANENIAIAESNDPAGPFQQVLKDSLPSPIKQIDPFVFIDNDGKKYLYHIRLTNGNRIFVAEMKDDLSAIIPETVSECIAATEEWENTANSNWPVAEGPSVLKHNGLYYLFYTANDFRNPDYAVGYATGSSPLGPWKKYEGNPIINKELICKNGPGHGDFLSDGRDLYYVFHTHNSATKVGPRKTAIVKTEFKSARAGVDILTVNKHSFHFVETGQ